MVKKRYLIDLEGIDIKEIPESFWEDIADMEIQKDLINKKIFHPQLGGHLRP
ncbi:MAG: hypothetical protein AB1797_01200 [bacterium]